MSKIKQSQLPIVTTPPIADSSSRRVPSYRPPSTIYPPSQPAPLYLDHDEPEDAEYEDSEMFLNSALLSANDPDLHLRLTRSATETIHEAISEDDRRRKAKKNRTRINNNSGPNNDSGRRMFQKRIPSRPPTINQHSMHKKNSTNLSDAVSNQPATPVQPPRLIPPMPVAPELEEEDEHTKNLKELEDSPAADLHRKPVSSSAQQKRKVYVNLELPTLSLDNSGDPIARYVRNKVRTTKYTIATFIPKNLYEQFRNVANVYFLVLVIFQVFPIFGAATPQVAMLPLLFILSVTALKDAFEDYRRYMIDNSVNNSACTRLGDWRNVNVPRAGGGTWWENFDWPWEKNQNVVDSIGQVRKITKGVRKLREREKDTFNTDFLHQRSNQSNNNINGSSDCSTSNYKRFKTNESEDENDDESEEEEDNQDENDVLSEIRTTRIRNSDDDRATTVRPGSSYPTSSRYRASSEIIDYSTPTPGTARWERTLWKKVEVGDIILLREDEAIPADLVVLSTSDSDGQCFVETKNLDGETNLKPRRSIKATRMIGNEEDVEHAHFLIESEPPNANLYAFNGSLKFWSKDETEGREHPLTEGRRLNKGSEKKESLGINEMLLRGCTLRNTQWVIGLVIFTGKDTKIMLNQGDTPSKKPKISRETNYAVIINFIVLVILCSINAIGDGVNQANSRTSAALYEINASVSSLPVLNALVTFGAALILFQSIVPISLVITLEFVRSIQALTIFRDIEMYYEPLNCPAEPKSWNLSDDLGQIEYIFSDKTGTLTQNVMEFQRCSISGIPYGEGITEAMIGASKRQQTDSSAIDDPIANSAALSDSKNRMIQLMKRSFEHRYLNPDQLTLISPKLVEDMIHTNATDDLETRQHQDRIHDFWRTLAICHDVIAGRGEGNDDEIIYKAESPDEAALVSGARDMGFVFLRRMGDRLEIEVMGRKEQYQMLQMIAFSSSRKRMSTIVRCPDGKIRLLCKGADSIIMSRLSPLQDETLRRKVDRDLESFATAGLRTLLVSSRLVEEEELEEFQRSYRDASDNGGTEREDLMEKVADKFERGLEILGATALEDKLQVGVPEAIEKLHEAGIKLWILTGDKLQTAIEIGYSCNLLKNTMEIMIISSDTEEGARSQIEQGLEKLMTSSSFITSSDDIVAEDFERRSRINDLSMNNGTKDSGLGMAGSRSTGEDRPVGVAGISSPYSAESSPKSKSSKRPKDGYAVVIDGDTLRYALDGSLKANFLALTVQCETVVCCRVSPAQKALTVKLVKEGKDAMTLAIGDGANDVAMIQEAHIGVGIAGLEGAQASMSADYALGQFRFLTKLLLVHGRWCYIRIADMHANFFFKNIIWTMVLFWYQIYCGFNGSYLFEYTFIMLFNLVFTSLPVGLMGAFEQDLSANASMAFPVLYRRGILGLQYTRKKFWLYMLDGTYQSVVAYWIPYFVYFSIPTASVTGRDVSVWEFGTTVACGAVFAANNLIVMNTRYFPAFIAAVAFLSSVSVLIWTALYSGLAEFYFKDVVLYTFSTFEFWASIVLVQVMAILPRLVYKYLQVQYWPRDSDIIRELIIARSHHSRGKGLEADLQHLKIVEQVIEKDKLDREASEKYSASKKTSRSAKLDKAGGGFGNGSGSYGVGGEKNHQIQDPSSNRIRTASTSSRRGGVLSRNHQALNSSNNSKKDTDSVEMMAVNTGTPIGGGGRVGIIDTEFGSETSPQTGEMTPRTGTMMITVNSNSANTTVLRGEGGPDGSFMDGLGFQGGYQGDRSNRFSSSSFSNNQLQIRTSHLDQRDDEGEEEYSRRMRRRTRELEFEHERLDVPNSGGMTALSSGKSSSFKSADEFIPGVMIRDEVGISNKNDKDEDLSRMMNDASQRSGNSSNSYYVQGGDFYEERIENKETLSRRGGSVGGSSNRKNGKSSSSLERNNSGTRRVRGDFDKRREVREGSPKEMSGSLAIGHSLKSKLSSININNDHLTSPNSFVTPSSTMTKFSL